MTLKVAKLGILVSECEEEASRLRTSMSIWQGPYQSAFGRQNYKEYKAKYDAVVAKKAKAENEAEKSQQHRHSANRHHQHQVHQKPPCPI